jgi:hypothetical protein
VFNDSLRVTGPTELVGNVTGGTPGVAYTAKFGGGGSDVNDATIIANSGSYSGTKSRLLLNRNDQCDLELQATGTIERLDFRNGLYFGTQTGSVQAMMTTSGKLRLCNDSGYPSHSLEGLDGTFIDSLRVNGGIRLGGRFISKIDGASASLNFGVPGAVPGSVDLTISVPGAVMGNRVAIGAPITIGANYILTGFVSAANTVTIRWTQIAGAAADPDGAGGTYTADVIQ